MKAAGSSVPVPVQPSGRRPSRARCAAASPRNQPWSAPGPARPSAATRARGGRGAFPFHAGAFVSAEVDVGPWEHVRDLVQHAPAEVEHGVVDPEDVLADPPAGPRVQPDAGPVAEFGVGGEGGAGVAGHLDLGDDAHPAPGRVGDEPGQLRPGVGALVRDPVTLGLGAAAAGPGEPGVGRDRHPPALVVGEVEVQDVELVQREQVHEAAYVGHGLEVAGHVQQGSAPGEPRPVGDPYAGHPPARGGRTGLRAPDCQCLGWQQLAQGLYPVEQPLGVGGAQQDGVGADGEGVPLGAEGLLPGGRVRGGRVRGGRVRGGQEEGDPPVGVGGQRQSGGGGEQFAQQAGRRLGSGSGAQSGVPVQGEAAGQGGDRVGARDEREVGTEGSGGIGRGCGHGVGHGLGDSSPGCCVNSSGEAWS